MSSQSSYSSSCSSMEVELDSDESDEVSIGEIKMETCKICSVEFDRAEHSPKVLPCCSIKACMKCLQLAFENLTINCPVCQVKTPCPDGLDSLPMSLPVFLKPAKPKGEEAKSELGMLVTTVLDSLNQGIMESRKKQKEASKTIIDARQAWTAEDVVSVWSLLVDHLPAENTFQGHVWGVMARLTRKLPPSEQDIFFQLVKNKWGEYDPKTKSIFVEVMSLNLQQVDTFKADHAELVSKMVDFLWTLPVENETESPDLWTGVHGLHRLLDMEQYAPDGDQLPRSLLEHWVKRLFDEIRKDVCSVRVLERLKTIFNIYQVAQQMEDKAIAKLAAGRQTRYPMSPSDVRISILGTDENRWRTFLIEQHNVIQLIAESLVVYVDRARQMAQDYSDTSNLRGNSFVPVGNDTHDQQVSYRLKLIHIFLKSFAFTLELPVAFLIWNCLVADPVFEEDREVAFKWLYELYKSNLMAPVNEDFFNATFLQLDPALLTDTGAECMIEFFISLFTPKLRASRQELMSAAGRTETDDSAINIPGLDYMWKVFVYGKNAVSEKALKLVKELTSCHGTRPMAKQEELRTDMLADLIRGIGATYDTFHASALNPETGPKFRDGETKKMIRQLELLLEYAKDFKAELNEGSGRITSLLNE